MSERPQSIDSHGHSIKLIGPGRIRVQPTLSDTLDEPNGASRGVAIHAAGAVKMALVGETDAEAKTRSTYVLGVVHSMSVRRVFATGTAVAATEIELVY